MAETLASATPLFERSPIVDVAVHEGEDDDAPKRGGRWPPRWPRLEQRVEIEWRNDPLLRIYPAGRKNGSTVAFNRKTIGRLDRSRLGERKPRAGKLFPVDSINRIANRVSESWFASLSIILDDRRDAGRVDGG